MTSPASIQPGPFLDDRAGFLLDQLLSDCPGIVAAVVLSVDGMLLAKSASFPRDNAEKTAAMASGMASLAEGASRELRGGAIETILIGMAEGNLLVLKAATDASNGARLAVLAPTGQDIGLVSYSAQACVDKIGRIALNAGPRHD
jgi:predicted regulator of Ras-like GTPase activity (Roadblock/LC7/MglB family)